MRNILIILVLLMANVSCDDKSPIENDEIDWENDQLADEDGCPDGNVDSDYNSWEASVFKCEKDSDCPEPDKEFCDPYGECQCRRGVEYGYMIRYKGKCMHWSEGIKYFCNNNTTNQFYLNSDVPRQGAVSYTNSKEDVVCRCDVGYYGQHCENRIKYDDILISNGQNFMPEPNCKQDEDCSESMKCSESGYCYCNQVLEFSDQAFDYYVKTALNKSQNDTVTGLDLINLRTITIDGVEDIEYGKCFVNMRSLMFSKVPENFDFTEISKMKNLQNIHILSLRNSQSIDYSPLINMEKLLFLYLMLNENSYNFLKNMKSMKHIVSLELEFDDGFVPPDLKFLSGYENLQQLIIQSFENNETEEIDISSLEAFEILMILKINLKLAKIKGLDVLSKLPNLIDLGIELYENENAQKLSSFPKIETVKRLTLYGVKSDIKLIERFPQLNVLNISGEGLGYKNLSFLEGLNHLHSLIFYDDYIDKEMKIEEGGYDYISKMTNLYSLTISPYKHRNMNWIKSLKHLVYTEIADVSSEWLPLYKADYLENGPVKTDFVDDLLYVLYLRDNLFHVEDLNGFAKNCSQKGAQCNSEFKNNFYTEPELGTVGFYLCGNPIKKTDENLEYLIENGAYVSIGTDVGQNCETYTKNNPPFSKYRKHDYTINNTDTFESMSIGRNWNIK
ncbi:MAG TPA: hypothetical protein PLW37_10460 [bacterium]|nr:hypothetical protein [bacterium]